MFYVDIGGFFIRLIFEKWEISLLPHHSITVAYYCDKEAIKSHKTRVRTHILHVSICYA